MKDKLIAFYRTIETPKITSVLLVFLCHETLKAIRTEAGLTVCILTYLLCYIAAQRFSRNYQKAKVSLSNKWQTLLFFLLYLYFVFSLLGIAFLEPYQLDAFPYDRYLFLPMAIAWTFPLFLQLLMWVDAAFSRSLPGETQFPLKWKIFAFAGLAASYSIWILAFNPCISTFDTGFLFNQAHIMGLEPILNWHPPFYAIVLHFLLKICDSATFLICVQCTAFAFLILRLLTLLLKKGISKKTAIFLYAVLGFAFNNVIQMITLWKDIPYMISILWLTVVLADLILTSGKLSKIWYVEFFFSLLLTALFRQNGIVPAIAAAVFITVYFIRRKKFLSLIPIAAFIMALVIIQGPVYSFYKVEDKPGLKYIALSNDIIGTYYAGCDTSDDVMKMLNEITENDPDHWRFNSYYSKYNSDALEDYSIPEFVSIYARTFFEHPSEMLNEFTKRNSIIWSIIKPGRDIRAWVNYTGEWHQNPEYEYTYPWRVPLVLTDGLSSVSNYLTDNSLIYILAWRTGAYVLGILFLLYFISKKKKMLYFIPFLPVLFNLFSLLAGSGWTDYRYYWPTAIMALFLMAYTRIILAPEKEPAEIVNPKADCPTDSPKIES